MTTFDTLIGGIKLTVTVAGAPTEVVVKQLPVSLYPHYLATMADECRQVELLCGQPEGWAESLSPESHEQIITTGDELNADFFGRWVARREARQKSMPKQDVGEIVSVIGALQKADPGLLERMMKSAGLSQSSLPKPPLPPA